MQIGRVVMVAQAAFVAETRPFPPPGEPLVVVSLNLSEGRGRLDRLSVRAPRPGGSVWLRVRRNLQVHEASPGPSRVLSTDVLAKESSVPEGTVLALIRAT